MASGVMPLPAAEAGAAEEGSAVVEFIFLGLLLLVPVIYLIVTAGQVQGAAFASVGAAEAAAKVYAAGDPDDPAAGEQQARRAAETAFTDFGFDPAGMVLEISCPDRCLAPGSTVTALVRFDVPLPLAPGIAGRDFAPVTVDSASTQMVERHG